MERELRLLVDDLRADWKTLMTGKISRGSNPSVDITPGEQRAVQNRITRFLDRLAELTGASSVVLT